MSRPSNESVVFQRDNQEQRKSFNTVPEDVTFQRSEIQAFLDEGRDVSNRAKNKTKKRPEDVKNWLAGKGHSNLTIERVLGDLDSYA